MGFKRFMILMLQCCYQVTAEQDNMILQLLQSFGRLHNASSLTACLPLPKSGQYPLEWGVLTFNLERMWQALHNNSGTIMIKIPQDQVMYYSNGSACWSNKISKLTTGETVVWSYENDKSNCSGITSKLPTGHQLCWNVEEKIRTKRQTGQTKLNNWMSLDCAKIPWGMDQTSIWEGQEAGVWRYHQGANWCLKWEGQKGTNTPSTETPLQNDVSVTDKLNCTQIYTCSTLNLEIQEIGPLARALRQGCLCRGLLTHVNQTWHEDKKANCLTDTVPSMGHTVWVRGDGTWMTHLPLNGKSYTFTLGLLTLCPLWRKNPITTTWHHLTKRDASTSDDPWRPPSSGVMAGWVLESIFSPQSMSLRNRLEIGTITGQIDILAKSTETSSGELNQQLQAASKMTLQNRQALDLLLAREHGLCGYLHKQPEQCCIHIPNVTESLTKQLDRIKQVAASTKEIKERLEKN